MSTTNPRIIPQTFLKGAIVTIHPRFFGGLPVGIQRHKRYTLMADSTQDHVMFKDDHGFNRSRPLYQFVQVA